MVPYDPGVELTDGEILLRPMQASDAPGIVAGLNDPDVARFMPTIPSPYTSSDAEAWVERCAEVWRTGESAPFAIVGVAGGELLGSIELNGATIGYWVAVEARGRGIATRALRLICEWATELPLRLTTHPANGASQRVAEKAGFRRIGITSDHLVFKDGTREAVLFELA
jgi:RimJ/RimL family protein N-acetyltransferase